MTTSPDSSNIQNNTNKKSETWLQKLKNRSWEMELLLSGFVLVLLLPLPTYIEREGAFLLTGVEFGIPQQFFTIVYIVGFYGSRILIVNLIAYVFLRGFWIGIIGLITVFPKGPLIQQQGYNKTFAAYLSRKTSSPESFATLIDKIGSSVFSFSFLAIFLVLALFSFLFIMILLMVLVILPVSTAFQQSFLPTLIQLIIFIPYCLAGGLFLIDFLSLGMLKKIQSTWFTRIYFPIYRLFRVITLAPLYTPIYYTLISNVSRRVLGIILIIYLGSFYFFTSYAFNDEIFFPQKNTSYEIAPEYYEENHTEKRVINFPTIPSEYTHQNYLRIFLPYFADDNDSLLAHCPEVKPFKGKGLENQSFFSFINQENTQKDSSAYTDHNMQIAIQCLADLYAISINDSLYNELKFYFHRKKLNGQAGIITYLPIKNLPSGTNLLKVEKKQFILQQGGSFQQQYSIPFVKE